MDWLSHFAQWVRETMLDLTSLAFVQPYLDATPLWAQLAAPLLVILLAVSFVFLLRMRTRSKLTSKALRCEASDRSDGPERAVGAGACTSIANEPRNSGGAPTPAAVAAATRAVSPTGTLPFDGGAVRVFISSTFLDMQRERDELVRRTFPSVRARFRARGVELLEVDLRWGITKEQSESGDTLPTLLAEIDRCRPYFIGLLGERYGWIPPATALTEELKAAFPSLAGIAGRSVTEMEFVHGVLDDPARANGAFFLERDPAWMETLTVVERTHYVESTSEGRSKLADLKQRIRASGVRVIPYRTPEEIGPLVEAALVDVFEASYPEMQRPDAFTQAASLHAAYARERRGLHVGAGRYLAKLDEWMSTTAAPPLLITGVSGGGKSTLVANWLQAHRNANPSDIVFEHYLGASPDSADPILLIRRLWEHLNRQTGESVDLPSGSTDLIDLSAGLVQRLNQAASVAQRKEVSILIALDGLDKLSTEQNLRWLPVVPHVKLLASTLDSEAKNSVQVRGWKELEVQPLNDAERRKFIEGTLKAWGRRLMPEHIDRILKHQSAGTPLFLKTVLDELRFSARYDLLDTRLDFYLGADGMPDLFARMLERLESDCGRGLVAKALSLVWASRAGLEEAEIITITGATPLAWSTLRNGLGDALSDRNGRITFGHDFLKQAVEMRYMPVQELKQLTHTTLADHFEKRASDARQAEELPHQLKQAEAWDRLEAVLIDIDRFEFVFARPDVEFLSYWLPLRERGRDPESLLCAAFHARAGEPEQWTEVYIDFAAELSNFLGFIGAHSDSFRHLIEARIAACERLLGAEHRKTLTSLLELSGFLHSRGDLERAQKMQERVLQARTRLLGTEHLDTLFSMATLAATLQARGDAEAAEKLKEHVVEKRTLLLGAEHRETLTAMNNLATSLYLRRDFEGARKLLERVFEASMRLFGPDHERTYAVAQGLAGCRFESGDFDGALTLLEGANQSAAHRLGPDHPVTLQAMKNLFQIHKRMTKLADLHFERGDVAGAIALQERAAIAGMRMLGSQKSEELIALAVSRSLNPESP
jgi:nephrocystin-3